MPEGLALIGRWHAPGSSRGWVVVEADKITTLAEHLVEWGSYLALETTPVVDAEIAGQAMASVYGK